VIAADHDERTNRAAAQESSAGRPATGAVGSPACTRSSSTRPHAATATFALREVVRHLLDERGFHRIEARTYGFNQSAHHAFQAAGFVQEGIRRLAYDRHGAWQDGVIFGLVADD